MTKRYIKTDMKKYIVVVFFLCLISNLAFCFVSPINGFLGVLFVIGLSALSAVLFGFLICHIWKPVFNILYAVLLAIYNLLIITDYYLLYEFGIVMNENTMGIVGETTWREISNFIQSYFQISSFLLGAIAVSILNSIILSLSAKFSQSLSWFIHRLSLLGVGVIVFLFFRLCFFGDGYGIPQFMSITRYAYSYKLMQKSVPELKKLAESYNCIEASMNSTRKHPNIVLVIGESFSKYHCSLYGYDKPTFPLLQELQDNDQLVVMNDAVAFADGTMRNMKAIFSMQKPTDDYAKGPLFPAVFHKAGYHTSLYDNQYLIGEGAFSFLNDLSLNNLYYDYRNRAGAEFDLELVEQIPNMEEPYLSIIHLWGQHYAYENRYPETFARYSKDDYSSADYSLEQREVIANYDNANLYNDYVLDQIIKKYKDDNCCIIYFSDHGEEVYELRDYMGHGNAMTSPDLRYQLDVPFFVWMSETFIQENPDLADRFLLAENLPIMTSDISHLLVELAGIDVTEFDAKRSFINVNYDRERHRIVQHNYDYDK